MSSSSLLWQGALSPTNTMLSTVHPTGRLLSMSYTQAFTASALNAAHTCVSWTTWKAEMAPIIWMFLPFDAGLTATALFLVGALPWLHWQKRFTFVSSIQMTCLPRCLYSPTAVTNCQHSSFLVSEFIVAGIAWAFFKAAKCPSR